MPNQLYTTLNKGPLVIEVVQKVQKKTMIIGSASLNLGLVSRGKKQIITNEDGIPGIRYMTSVTVAVSPPTSTRQITGEIYVILRLDDFGIFDLNSRSQIPAQMKDDSVTKKLVQDSKANNSPKERDDHVTQSLPPPAKHKTNFQNTNFQPNVELSSSDIEALQQQMAVQVAIELEQWKSLQQENFQIQLKEKETECLNMLAAEWRKRETERKFLFQRQMTECQDMQEKLQRALSDIDKRERVLATKEAEFHQTKLDFEQIRERHEKEIKTGCLRLHEEFDHRLRLEREKTQEMENQKVKLEFQATDLEKRLESKTQEFENYRQQQRNHPELHLQSEVHLLSLEKAELERKLEASTKSKVHYKQQWGRCLRELARIKQRMEEEARAQLYRQQQELESMRLQYMASEGKSEQAVLQEIKGDINLIKETVSKKISETQENKPPRNHRISFLDSDFDSDNETDQSSFERLKRERETLLQTGVYTEDDRIIRELDRQIKESVARKVM